MSVDYTAYAVIGVQVPTVKLYRLVQKRNCNHEFDLSFAYCPSCGKQTYSLEKQPIFNEINETIDGMQVIRPTDSDTAYVARYYARTDHYNDAKGLASFDFEQGRKDLQRTLEPLGLWDASLYRLWAVIDVSY